MAQPKAIGYVRVSTLEQVKGAGLEVQERAIRDFCRANKLRLVSVYRDEGQSGSNGLGSRIGLAEALAALKAGEAETMVVYRLDRLARDLLLQETLVEQLRSQGTPVTSATEDLDLDSDDPTKVLIRQIIGVVAQYERAVIRGRMMAGKAAKREAGGYVGGQLPYGFRLENGQVVPDPAEQEVVAFIGRRALAGASLRSIITDLDAAGFSPRAKPDGSLGRWHPTTVSRIVNYTPAPAGRV